MRNAALTGRAAIVFFGVLQRLSQGQLGAGDVELRQPPALLGALSPGHVILGLYATFAAAGIVSAALVLTGRAIRSSRLPLGPDMIAGTLLDALL